jgi:hypothetical protein
LAKLIFTVACAANKWLFPRAELFEKVVQTLVDTKTRMDVINVCKLLGEVRG